jgi:predicted ATPase
VEHAGRLVTQDELLEALWPATYVNPGVLRKYILEIRRRLGDRADTPIFIETLPKRGYQFVAPVIDESAAGTWAAAGTNRIVGREPALAELSSYLSQARRSERQIVFITGELGIGKTALADEFQRRARVDSPGVRIARGQCVEGYGGMEAYYPVLEALGELCQESEGVVRILAKQAPTWLVQFPALVSNKQRDMLQREILGATRERMLREIGEALEAITSEKPLLLVLEDLHWADASTIDFISALARRRAPAKLMLIGTYRPADVKPAEHPLEAVKQDLLVHRLCHEIVLQPLEEAEVAEYLGIEWEGAAVPEGFAGLIHRYTGGNPLFMCAVLEHMQDRGLITAEHGVWHIETPLENIDLEAPESLRHMIELQIERLSEEEQRVLEIASVLRKFPLSVAIGAAVSNLEPDTVEELLDGLARRHQVVRSVGVRNYRTGPSPCYEFVHVLYREVFYSRLGPARRKKLHRRVAENLEALHVFTETEVASELAQHFELGEDWLRAIKYLQFAADIAGWRFEPRQAASILEHALELVKKLPEAERAEYQSTILEDLAKIYIAWVRKVTGR